jgi:hypothetical protein
MHLNPWTTISSQVENGSTRLENAQEEEEEIIDVLINSFVINEGIIYLQSF